MAIDEEAFATTIGVLGRNIAQAITSDPAEADSANSLTQAMSGVAASLHEIGEAIRELAAAVRERPRNS